MAYNSTHTGQQINNILDNANQNAIINLIYPVGSIYMSVNNTSPATLFGGTWTQLKDKFLLTAGDTYAAGSTGGSATSSHTHTINSHTHSTGNHTLTTSEMPAHSHDVYSETINGYSSNRPAWLYSNPPSIPQNGNLRPATTDWGATGSNMMHGVAYTRSVGGGGAHNHGNTGDSGALTSNATSINNLPPYLVVYCWQRTA